MLRRQRRRRVLLQYRPRVSDHVPVSLAGTAPLAGIVETVAPESHPNQLIVRLDEPSPGADVISTCAMGERTFFVGNFSLSQQHGPYCRRANPKRATAASS